SLSTTPPSSLFPYTTLFRSYVIRVPARFFYSKNSNFTAIQLRESLFFRMHPNVPAQCPGRQQLAVRRYYFIYGREKFDHYFFFRSEEHTSELQSRDKLVSSL